MQYKVGDRVVLKWPERSDWDDTMRGAEGILRVGNTYIIEQVHDKYGYRNKDGLRTLGPTILITDGNIRWYLSPSAVELLQPKRKLNLPVWW